jgi:hypothetical protein
MRPQTELSEPGVADAGEITATEVLDEFLAVMHEWEFRAFRYPLSQGVCGGVDLPGPDVLLDRARLARLREREFRAGRTN